MPTAPPSSETKSHTYKPLTYISIFSGIEAASVAWEPLGFQPLAFAEMDPFPSAVLKERYPHVPNLGDVTKIDWKKWSEENEKPDIIVGGSPCQSFSIAGKREGLKGESGLMYEYIRAVREVRPRYFAWENVPGALSSEKGAAFGQLLREMDDLGYGLAWRVLDAQFFGVAQRRRRIFLIGCSGDPRRAAEVLFEPESLRWDHPSGRKKREELARAARHGAQKPSIGTASISGNIIGRTGKNGGNQIGINEEDLSFTLTTADIPAVCSDAWPFNPWDCQTSRVYRKDGVAPTILSNNAGGYKGGFVLDENISANSFIYNGSADARGIGLEEEQSPTLIAEGKPPAVAFTQNTRDEVHLINGDGSLSGCLCAAFSTKQQTYVAEPSASNGEGQVMAFNHNASGSFGFAEAKEMSPTLRACANNTSNMPAVVYSIPENAINRPAGGTNGPMAYGCSEPSSTLRASCNVPAVCHTQYGEEMAGGETPHICRASGMANAETMEDCCPTQTARQHKDPPILAGGSSYIVRRLTPLECERLQGFPDEWTRISWRGKEAEECPDTPRYKALGNSMAVPVMRWLGYRIQAMQKILKEA